MTQAEYLITNECFELKKSYTNLEQHKSIKEVLDNAFCKFVTESLHRNDEMIKKYSK